MENSRKKSFDILTIEIVEKHRKFMSSSEDKNIELEEYIEKRKEAYARLLKKIK